MTLLTIREASRLIGRTPATVRRYIRSGRLKAGKEPGKFGEEYRILRDDLLALGVTAPAPDLPARRETAPPDAPVAEVHPAEGTVPVSLFNELLMKHEQLLVQYGMIRAGGQKLLDYKADAEAKDEELRRGRERYQALRARAAREITFLRKHLRQAEIEIEDRNIEIVLLQEKIKRLEMAAASAASIDGLERTVVEIRDKERRIQELEGAGRAAPPETPQPWYERVPSAGQGEDH
jgi:excisionase family DNA binding protein